MSPRNAAWEELATEFCPSVPPDQVTICLVVAHPDDEIIGAGASLLPYVARCTIVHVTDGAPANLADARAAGFDTRRAYAAERRQEARRAIALGRSRPCEMIELEIEDQRASHELAGIATRLATLLCNLHAPLVLTHPYEGGHPDHDATAFAVHAARDLLHAQRRPLPVIEFTSYHSENGQTIRTDFLPYPGAGAPLTFMLTPAEQALKRQMFQCFRTQAEVLRWFPTEVERFRLAPVYDFTRAPHAGTLHYEHYPWGMTGNTWRKLAAGTRARLMRGRPDEHDRALGGVPAGQGES